MGWPAGTGNGLRGSADPGDSVQEGGHRPAQPSCLPALLRPCVAGGWRGGDRPDEHHRLALSIHGGALRGVLGARANQVGSPPTVPWRSTVNVPREERGAGRSGVRGGPVDGAPGSRRGCRPQADGEAPGPCPFGAVPGACQGCGAPLSQAGTGRPRKWCGRGRCEAQENRRPTAASDASATA